MPIEAAANARNVREILLSSQPRGLRTAALGCRFYLAQLTGLLRVLHQIVCTTCINVVAAVAQSVRILLRMVLPKESNTPRICPWRYCCREAEVRRFVCAGHNQSSMKARALAAQEDWLTFTPAGGPRLYGAPCADACSFRFFLRGGSPSTTPLVGVPPFTPRSVSGSSDSIAHRVAALSIQAN